MPFWAAHTTVSSTTSAGSQRIGQDATPSCPGLAIDRSLREGPLDQPGGFSRICGASRHYTAVQGTGWGLHESHRNTGNSTASPAVGTPAAAPAPDHGRHMDAGPAPACVSQKYPWSEPAELQADGARPGEEWPAS